MSNSQVWKIAEKAWADSRKSSVVKKKCRKCFDAWRSNDKQGQCPPLFPLDFKGKCPACGGVLDNAAPI